VENECTSYNFRQFAIFLTKIVGFGESYGTIADNINNFFHSVSADLAPLDWSLMPAATDPVPQEFVIEPHQVENKLAKLQPNKACGPDNIPN